MPSPDRKKNQFDVSTLQYAPLGKDTKVFVNLDDDNYGREVIELTHEFNMYINSTPMISCRSLEEVSVSLTRINELGAKALLLLDANLGNLTPDRRPDEFEGVKFGIQLMKLGTQHSLIFISANGYLIPDFIAKELEKKVQAEKTLDQLNQGRSSELNLDPTLSVLEHTLMLRKTIQEIQALIANINVLAGIITKPYSPTSLGNTMVRFISPSPQNEARGFEYNLGEINGKETKTYHPKATDFFFPKKPSDSE